MKSTDNLPSLPAPLPQRIAENLNALPKAHRKRYQPRLLLECYNTLIHQAAEIKELKLRLGDPLGEDNRPLVVLDENIPQMINRVIDPETRQVDPEGDAEHIRLWQACKADPAADSEAHKALDAFKACHEMEMQPCVIQQDRGDGNFYSIIHPATWAKFTDEYRRQFKTIIAPKVEALPASRHAPPAPLESNCCEKHDCKWTGPCCPMCQDEAAARGEHSVNKDAS